MSRTYHHNRDGIRPASLRTTIRVSALRQDEDHIASMQRYAMKRYNASWAERNHSMASMWFNAADRCARLARIIAG